MKTYREFHGNMVLSQIGKRLREIVKVEKNNFKILTGYGSKSGSSKSKLSALKSLSLMKKEGLIKGYIPGEVKKELLDLSSPYFEDKLKYDKLIKNDSDYGNSGIIFIFIK